MDSKKMAVVGPLGVFLVSELFWLWFVGGVLYSVFGVRSWQVYVCLALFGTLPNVFLITRHES